MFGRDIGHAVHKQFRAARLRRHERDPVVFQVFSFRLFRRGGILDGLESAVRRFRDAGFLLDGRFRRDCVCPGVDCQRRAAVKDWADDVAVLQVHAFQENCLVAVVVIAVLVVIDFMRLGRRDAVRTISPDNAEERIEIQRRRARRKDKLRTVAIIFRFKDDFPVASVFI